MSQQNNISCGNKAIKIEEFGNKDAQSESCGGGMETLNYLHQTSGIDQWDFVAFMILLIHKL